MLNKLIKKSENLGGERYRRAFLASLMNVVSQAVQLLTGLISVPLTLNYVGVERFGIWMTLSTALVFITFADFGVGIGLQDRVSKYIGAGNYELAQKAFFSSFLFIFIMCIVLIGVGHVFVSSIDLSELFSLRSKEAIEEIAPTTEMVIVVLGLGLLAGVVQRTYNGFQDGFFLAVLQIIARLLSLILLFVVVHLEIGLPALVFVVGGLFSVLLIIIGLPGLFIRHKCMLPQLSMRPKLLDLCCLKDILKIGALGLGASIAIYFVNNSIPLLIASKFGVENVADYAVLLKLLSIPGLFLTYLLLPLWPAITEAKVQNDNYWIKKTYERSRILILGLSVICVGVFLPFGQDIVRLWTHNEDVVPSVGLLFASIVFMLLGFWNALTSVMLNGLSMYKGQATYGMALAVIFVLIALIMPNSYGKEFVVWVVTAGYFIRCILMQVEVSRYFLKCDYIFSDNGSVVDESGEVRSGFTKVVSGRS